MEAHRRNNRRSNALLLLLTVSLAATSSASPIDGEKVELSLYYEALCPYCENFIINYLYKIFDNGLISIVDLKLSPYGNAKIRSNGTIVCQNFRHLEWRELFSCRDFATTSGGRLFMWQFRHYEWRNPMIHGEWECVLNTVEACAIHAWPVVSDHFPFIYCVESLTYEQKYDEWETCFEKLNLDPKPVTDCITSGFGHELLLQYADEINALEPPHTYVPWVVVDGQPIYDDYTDFVSFICKAYKGSNPPQACLDFALPTTTPNNNAEHFNHVCYKEDNNAKSKSTLSETISAAAASWLHHVSMAESM